MPAARPWAVGLRLPTTAMAAGQAPGTVPFTYSITNGIGAGVVLYTVLNARRAGVVLWIVSAVFVLYFAFGNK